MSSMYVNPMTSAYAVKNASQDIQQLKQRVAAKELEEYFVRMLFRELRATVPEGGLFGGGPESKMFIEMLDDTLSGVIAEQGQLGIGAMVDKQLASYTRSQAPQDGPGFKESA